MAGPALARNDTEGDRFYTWKGESFYSVTTIIGGGIPKYLERWAAKAVAERVHRDLSTYPAGRNAAAIRRWAKAGRADVERRQAAGELPSIKLAKLSPADLALRWIKGEPERIRDAAAELGVEVHDEAEALVLKLARADVRMTIAGEDVDELPPWPEHLAGHMTSFRSWLGDFDPEFVATEASVFHRDQAYAGTLDAIVRIRLGDRPVTVIVDYKSGGGIYPEVAIQLAAYARAQFMGLPDKVTEAPIPPVDAAAVLHLTPKGYRFRLVRHDDVVFNAFLYAREVYRWRKELAATALMQDLTPAPAPASTEEVA